MEVAMSKKRTPLWREAHFQVKSAKKLPGTDHFWTFRCPFAWHAQGIVHLVTSEQNLRALQQFQPDYTTPHYTTLHYNYNYNYKYNYNYNYIALHYTNYITLH